LSHEQVLSTLVNLGFDEIDAKIYVYLAKKGMQKASNINKALKLTKQQFYPSIRRMESKGIVNSTIEHPARFSAIPFEKLLDLFIKEKIEETRSLKQRKAEILANWHSLKMEEDTSAKFTVIEGRNFIYSKIYQMLQESTSRFLAITTLPVLVQADQRDIFDAISNHRSKKTTSLRFLTELSDQNVTLLKSLMKEFSAGNLNVNVRYPELGLSLFPHMIIKDEDEVLFFVKPRTENSLIEKHDTCLWTDCKTLVKSFIAIFEDLWRNSTDAQEKIAEIETGKPTPKTLVFSDIEIAKKKFEKIAKSAKEEVLMIAPAKELSEFSGILKDLNEWKKSGLAIKIMVPIVQENLETAHHLSQICLVKHVPPNYSPIIIVDGKHLFQFKEPSSQMQQLDFPFKIENVLYTNNINYVQKNKLMMDELWKNSSYLVVDSLESSLEQSVLSHCAYYPGAILGPGPHGKAHPLPPDPVKLKSYSGVEIVNEDPEGKLKEQDILNEIIRAQRSSIKKPLGLQKVYASQAIALIHPPDFFKLPPMLIRVHRIEKMSTFGAEDAVFINLWLDLPNGSAFVPVAVFSDNPSAKVIWEKHFSASPAGRNIKFAQKNELQIWVHGNTMFAGWTVPIPLYPPEYTLPPACMLVEGYGDVKTEAFSVIQASGGKFSARQNGFDAFVTLMYSSSKYSGPGTDGFMVRDYVMEITPQFTKNFHSRLENRIFEKQKPE
jgi:sugar-specific transcriptional regulator TrmB